MSYDDDDDDYEPSNRKGQKRRPGLSSPGMPKERVDALRDLTQEVLANCATVRPGQIFAVQPGNAGKHTDDTIEQALWQSAGKLSFAAGWLGMSRKTLKDRIDKSERLTEVISEIEELGIDVAEVQLDALILAGNDKAVALKLKTKGKGRGWAESKQQGTGNTLTLDAARELEARMVTAFAMARQLATDAVIQPARQIEVKAEPAPAAPEPDDELEGEGLL